MDKNMDTKSTQTPTNIKPVNPEKKKKKKKKKKQSYKDMMAQILKPTITDEERIAIKQQTVMSNGLGGGNFGKLERI